MIIDSHQHFWKYEAENHAWINDEMSVIRKDSLPSDLEKIYKENGVEACIAKPYIKDGFYDVWAALMLEVGKHENIYCELSGMTTEADYKQWTVKQMQPYMELVLKAFGLDRLMFGSDWPVCLVAGNYTVTKELVTNFIKQLNESEAINPTALNQYQAAYSISL